MQGRDEDHPEVWVGRFELLSQTKAAPIWEINVDQHHINSQALSDLKRLRYRVSFDTRFELIRVKKQRAERVTYDGVIIYNTYLILKQNLPLLKNKLFCLNSIFDFKQITILILSTSENKMSMCFNIISLVIVRQWSSQRRTERFLRVNRIPYHISTY